jgi:hypothetical protein
MTKTNTTLPLKIYAEHGNHPYIRVPLTQLETIKKLLDEDGHVYRVFEYAISHDGKPLTAIIDLDRRADLKAIQTVLDGVD